MKTHYIDAFVLVVPKDKVENYKKMAQEGCNKWMKHGALSYRECMGDDLSPDNHGMTTCPFPQLVNLQENETVWFSYIEYASREHRDAVNAKVMAAWEEDKQENSQTEEECASVMDMQRFSFGGFEVVVSN